MNSYSKTNTKTKWKYLFLDIGGGCGGRGCFFGFPPADFLAVCLGKGGGGLLSIYVKELV